MSDLIYSYFDRGFGAFIIELSACIIITVLLMTLFRILFGEKFKCGWRYALWIILPICFLIPYKFMAPYSVIELPMPVDFPLHIDTPEMTFTGIMGDEGWSTSGYEADILMFGTVVFLIWITVSAVMLCIQLIKLHRLNVRIRRRGIVCGNAQYNEILKNVCAELKISVPKLIIFPETDTPFAAGIFRPRIILPHTDYTPEEAEFIFRHEAVHIRRKDILIKLMLIVFRAINWFDPFVYVMCKEAFEDMEISCDEAAAKNFSDTERARYSETILKGISGKKYPAVTTYLSSDARSLKKRISAVMKSKRLSSAVPFAIALPAILLLTGAVYSPTGFYGFSNGYVVPYPFEEDPYITTEEWRSCTASDAEEAGEMIFRKYMDMYTAENVPEYYRVEDYRITDIMVFGEEKSFDLTHYHTAFGAFDNRVIAQIEYNIETANKCGNTAHNANIGRPCRFNGAASGCLLCIELDRDGNEYTVVNMGWAGMMGTPNFHFINRLDEALETAQLMAECGLLDNSFDITADNLPSADGLAAFCYYKFKEYNPVGEAYADKMFLPFKPFNIPADEEYLKSSALVNSETGIISVENYPLKEAGFEFCGYDYDCETGGYTVYGNVTGEASCGVVMEFEYYEENYSYLPSLMSLTVSDTLYAPVEYTDSFDKLPETDELKKCSSAEEMLEYMKTPREGCDFTVLDYRNISEEADGTYAEVKFKGRLNGIYSSDLAENEDSDGYIRVKIL